MRLLLPFRSVPSLHQTRSVAIWLAGSATLMSEAPKRPSRHFHRDLLETLMQEVTGLEQAYLPSFIYRCFRQKPWNACSIPTWRLRRAHSLCGQGGTTTLSWVAWSAAHPTAYCGTSTSARNPSCATRFESWSVQRRGLDRFDVVTR